MLIAFRKEVAVMGLDEQCYERFLSGELAAYDELMIRYGDGLIIYLNGYLHDWHDAEDLMIESFARIMVKKPAIREGGFKPYLYKTARNLAFRYVAKKHRKGDFYLGEFTEDLPDSMHLEKQILDEERKSILHLCMSRIDPGYREALWLVYMEGLSYTAAAEVMGVSKKKIDNLLSRGKTVLRKELEKEGMSYAH